MGSGIQVTDKANELYQLAFSFSVNFYEILSMEAIFPCFNLKPDDCHLATTLLVHKLSHLHKTLMLITLWLKFLQLE